ncbi:DUF2147 domain-containing protein [Acidipila sp. EB88]|uniref:DUF2147 domain-containing protein n=1 Tax=Acidipila sp. EB88 TaxID=2305226 RepID=UPI000FA989D1|nr:DUF2147 domain-containing protein [Acidipila sp. EB88]RRA48524.1 DUF2147 domain-containing protein [Acidipila sp. EB88]
MLALALLLATPSPADTQASQLTGDWKTPNNSVLRIQPCEGSHLCVRIVTIGPKDQPSHDVNNPDASLRARDLCGLMIGTAFTPDGAAAAKDGKVYDPESGKTYSAKMQAEGDSLNLRGFIGFSLLGRTETWHRTSTAVAACK